MKPAKTVCMSPPDADARLSGRFLENTIQILLSLTLNKIHLPVRALKQFLLAVIISLFLTDHKR